VLEDAGYRSVEDLAREDPDRLALKSGLGVKKAKAVQGSAIQFLDRELSEIHAARAAAKAQRTADADSSEVSGSDATPEA
jgi:N utilization substance protein A